MKRYLILLCLITLSLSLLNARIAAKIGDKEYSIKEIKSGFEAYKEFHEKQISESGIDDSELLKLFFDEMIAKYIYDREVKVRGIMVSTEDLEAELKSRPPSVAFANEKLFTDDEFDFAKYLDELERNASFKQELMESISDTFAFTKLLEEVRSEATIDRNLIKEQWLSMGNQSEASIIRFITEEIEAEVTEADALALYEATKQEYLREDGRSLRYVYFSSPATSRRAQIYDDGVDETQKAQELLALARQKGLVKAAQELDYEVSETPPFCEEDGFIRGIGRDIHLINKIFNSFANETLALYKSHLGGIFVYEVAGVFDSYYIPFEIEKDQLMLKAAFLKRQEAKEEEIVEFITGRSSAEYLQEARNRGYEVFEQIDITSDSSFGEHGNIEGLNQAILSTFEGDFTPLIVDQGRYFIAQVNRHYVRDENIWALTGDLIVGEVSKVERQKHLDEWYQAQLNALDILYPTASQILK
ncbi:MAG TPA: hypothetical protein GXX77_06680 [Candidatus Cloacimonetes bacterium]|nr:hypothetical protein [Candidatus Cloacimonadota bacterium]